jgi:hypothetical protein
MTAGITDPRPFRNPVAILIALFAITLSLLIGARASTALAAEQPAVQASSADLGIASILVPADAIVRTPIGIGAGPTGVETYVASVTGSYPDAQFDVTDTTTVGNLIIVDWQGTQDGAVIFPGRTLIAVEAGVISEITIVSRSSIAPVAGEPATIGGAGEASVYYELPYEQARPVVIVSEQELAIVAATEAQAWPNFDSTALADRQLAVEAAAAEAQAWPDFDSTAIVTQSASHAIVDEQGHGFAPERFATDAEQDAR